MMSGKKQRATGSMACCGISELLTSFFSAHELPPDDRMCCAFPPQRRSGVLGVLLFASFFSLQMLMQASLKQWLG